MALVLTCAVVGIAVAWLLIDRFSPENTGRDGYFVALWDDSVPRWRRWMFSARLKWLSRRGKAGALVGDAFKRDLRD